MDSRKAIIADDRIVNLILDLRGEKIILDSDLAELYGVETRRLNEQVRRNKRRFPQDFMFQVSKEEFENLKSHFATSKQGWGGRRKLPFAFTEHGAIKGSLLKEYPLTAEPVQVQREVRINSVGLRLSGASPEDLLFSRRDFIAAKKSAATNHAPAAAGKNTKNAAGDGKIFSYDRF
ncbi:MAG: ORF6N domain-containing protein [Syntrophales bacterium]|nr:ORF6N domain-containing protein [Syntrophales bacterium]